MTHRFVWPSCIGLAACMAISAVAQTAVATSSAYAAYGSPWRVTGHPYSAEQTMEHVQTLADGTHITQTMQQTKYYRDSEGRTRIEHFLMPPPGAEGAPIPSMIRIEDPVAGVSYTFNAHEKTTRRAPWPPTAVRNMQTASAKPQITVVQPANAASTTAKAAAASSGRPHPLSAHESLGTQTIEGLLVEGKRITTTIPVGFMGNDRPITTTTETWSSPDLKVPVLSKTTDPRSGEITTRLTNILQAEPDPSLFQPPAEYSIVEAPN